MEKEIWKSIKNYDGKYEVSNTGRIKSLARYYSKVDIIMKPFILKGYEKVTLMLNGKRSCFRVNRLVAEAFLDNLGFKSEVNHIDANKKNNNVSNLEWAKRKENLKHAHTYSLFKKGEDKHNSKLNNLSVLKIREMASIGCSSYKISKLYNVSQAAVFYVIKRKTWKHIT